MSVCPACGTVFSCGMVDRLVDRKMAEPCWCVQLPRLVAGELVPVKDGAQAKCFCPDCLRQRKNALRAQPIKEA